MWAVARGREGNQAAGKMGSTAVVTIVPACASRLHPHPCCLTSLMPPSLACVHEGGCADWHGRLSKHPPSRMHTGPAMGGVGGGQVWGGWWLCVAICRRMDSKWDSGVWLASSRWWALGMLMLTHTEMCLEHHVGLEHHVTF